MRRTLCILAILSASALCLGACDDGAGDALPADVSMRDVLAPDLGPPPTCLDVCSAYRQNCGEALLLQPCDGCTEVFEGTTGAIHPETYARAIDLCRAAESKAHCPGLAGCLADNDGLTGVAQAAQVTVRGTVFDVAIDLSADDAVAVLGSKSAGGPSDLVVLFEVEDTFYRLEIDDLGADAGDSPLQAQDNVVTLESVSSALLLDAGTIELQQFVADGPLALTADLRPAERPEDQLTVTITGTWEGQF